nr:hypothetical protein GCM10020185_84790 [Pseudomonas brassicacearum subsp. brassicacearum]
MLALLGLAMVVVFTFLIMTKRLSPIVALTVVPIVFAVLGGFGGTTGKMMLDGLKMVAPSAALLLFAILFFFGLMIDAGLFDPLIRKILKRVNGDPMKIAVGTALLSLLVALDGDGTTTYMITCAAMLPLYKRIGMNPMILATVSMLSLSIMSGMTPWGGPATRAIAALGLDAGEYFVPLLPTMIGGAMWVVFTAFLLGRAERKRIGNVQLQSGGGDCYINAIIENTPHKRPKLAYVNLLLVVAVMVALVMGLMHSAILFLIGFVLALMINYPQLDIQKERILAHSGNAMTVVLLVFAAGIFAGIFFRDENGRCPGTNPGRLDSAFLGPSVPAGGGDYQHAADLRIVQRCLLLRCRADPGQCRCRLWHRSGGNCPGVHSRPAGALDEPAGGLDLVAGGHG